MTYLYLDIETIGCQDESKIDFDSAIPRNITKEETKQKWIAENRQSVIDKTGLDGWLGHIVQICAEFEGTEFSTTVKKLDSEYTALLEFVEFARWANSFGHNNPPVIVGHNVNGFDIPFIWKRALCLDVKLPLWFPKKPKEWSTETVDTMLAFCQYKEFISLDKLCGYLGIEGKGDMDGSKVGQYWREGRYKEIQEYCRDDVRRVKQIHEKMIKVGM